MRAAARWQPALRRLAAGLLAGAASWTAAHEPGAEALPETPGWRLGVAAALVAVDAREPFPAPQWPGVLIFGSAPRDQRGGLRVEHAVVDAGLRLQPLFGAELGAHLAVGVHDRDRPHTEAARVLLRWPLGGPSLELGLGRDTVRMGAAIDGAGHFDLFSLGPLAKRAVLNEQWVDDGLSLAWRRPVERGVRAVELGLWRGQAFPGGPRGETVPTLHLHAGYDHLDAHVFAARLAPQGRGAAVMSAGASGHLHTSPDCRATLRQLVCFDGKVEVLGGSLQWAPESLPLSFTVAGLARRERGALYSLSGDARYTADVQGAWADAVWQPGERWSGALRLERLAPRNTLAGVGAELLAREAGLIGGAAIQRWTVALLHAPWPGLQVALEAGQERGGALRQQHVALRLLWRQPALWGGAW
jgi:hypothetical protein